MRIELFLFSVSLVFISCVPGLTRREHKPIEMPQQFPQEAENPEAEKLAEKVVQEFFRDQTLYTLVENAVANNKELAVLEQEIHIANSEVLSRYGEYLPKVSAQANLGVEQTERFSTPDANSQTRFSRGGLVLNWEVDIWKKLRNATKAAYMRYLASIEGRRYVTTQLVAEVADTYYELLALESQVKLIDDYIAILTKAKNMVTLQRDAGRTTSLGVKRFEAELAKNAARQFDLKRKLAVTENRLNLLMARFPQKIEHEPVAFQKITLPEISFAVPVKLLENRPDIKRAMLELEARKLDVEVARARFYPSLTIDGLVGYEAFNGEHFDGTPVSFAYGAVAGLTAPLLNRQAIKANYFAANDAQIQAIYQYEYALLNAFTEVTNQILTLRNLKSNLAMKEKQVESLRDAVKIADVLFRAARMDYIEVLFTQRDLLEAEMELIETRKSQLAAAIGLYRALGGGWRGFKEAKHDEHWQP